MRLGEILAIQLGKISEHSVLIDKRVYKGDVDPPKGRKGKRTSRIVDLSLLASRTMHSDMLSS